MVLKAAYFSLIGRAETAVLTWPGDILPAITRGRRVFGIAWPNQGQGHNVRAWAELLVLERAANPGWAYRAPAFAAYVQNVGQRFEPLWRNTPRPIGAIAKSKTRTLVLS
jgi:hypothetical protein